jgi:hypothetical protein
VLCCVEDSVELGCSELELSTELDGESTLASVADAVSVELELESVVVDAS